MLNPLLLSEHDNQNTLPPDRVVGLLTVSSGAHRQAYALDKVVEYYRPEHEHPMLTSARWVDFLHIEENDQKQSMAVFGFAFDGEAAWYKLWNESRRHVCWVKHSDKFDYKPFAILAMDALITLQPNWHGWLWQYPASEKPVNPFLPIAADRIDQRQVERITVSDASTNLAGDLWFLVTINSTDAKFDDKKIGSELSPTRDFPKQVSRSGWITQLSQ